MPTTVKARDQHDTADLADLDPVPDGYELIDGELVRKPVMGAEASLAASELYFHLRTHLATHPVGIAITSDPGFRCFPDRPKHVRKPDVVVLLDDPTGFRAPRGDIRVVPAIVAEIVSPKERSEDTMGRIEDFLAAGTRLAWVVYPRRRSVFIYRPNGTANTLHDPADLTGEDVLPGFSVPLAAFLPRVPPA
jgi:Uma2 family endonuclease